MKTNKVIRLLSFVLTLIAVFSCLLTPSANATTNINLFIGIQKTSNYKCKTNGNGSVSLDWSGMVKDRTLNASKFKIFKARYDVKIDDAVDEGETCCFDKSNSTAFDNSPKYDTTYYYVLVACDRKGNTIGYYQPKNECKPYTKPNAPNLKSVKSLPNCSIELKWNYSENNGDNQSNGVLGYKIFRKVASSKKDWICIKTTKSKSFIDQGLKNGVQYSYTICAYKKDGYNQIIYGNYDKTGLSARAMKNKGTE